MFFLWCPCSSKLLVKCHALSKNRSLYLHIRHCGCVSWDKDWCSGNLRQVLDRWRGVVVLAGALLPLLGQVMLWPVVVALHWEDDGWLGGRGACGSEVVKGLRVKINSGGYGVLPKVEIKGSRLSPTLWKESTSADPYTRGNIHHQSARRARGTPNLWQPQSRLCNNQLFFQPASSALIPFVVLPLSKYNEPIST